MDEVYVSNSTREQPIPEHVKGMSWKISGPHRISFNSYGGIDFHRKDSYNGLLARWTLKDARALASALTNALAAYDNAEFVPDPPDVDFWALKSAIGFAEGAARDAQRRADEAKKLLETLEARLCHATPSSESSPGPETISTSDAASGSTPSESQENT